MKLEAVRTAAPDHTLMLSASTGAKHAGCFWRGLTLICINAVECLAFSLCLDHVTALMYHPAGHNTELIVFLLCSTY